MKKGAEIQVEGILRPYWQPGSTAEAPFLHTQIECGDGSRWILEQKCAAPFYLFHGREVTLTGQPSPREGHLVPSVIRLKEVRTDDRFVQIGWEFQVAGTEFQVSGELKRRPGQDGAPALVFRDGEGGILRVANPADHGLPGKPFRASAFAVYPRIARPVYATAPWGVYTSVGPDLDEHPERRIAGVLCPLADPPGGVAIETDDGETWAIAGKATKLQEYLGRSALVRGTAHAQGAPRHTLPDGRRIPCLHQVLVWLREDSRPIAIPDPAPEPESVVRHELGANRTAADRQVGRFQIRRTLGAGTLGNVYVAHDPGADRDVLLRLVPLSQLVPPDEAREARARLFRHAGAVATIRHRNIAPLYEFGEDRGDPYLVTQFIEGWSLEGRLGTEVVKQRRNLFLAGVAQVAEALDYAHQGGTFHGGPKASSIVIGKDRRFWLVDLGIPRLIGATYSREGFTGRLGFLAPEQLRLEPPTARSDQFSLGVIVYQLLSGELPFRGGSMQEIGYQTLYAAPASLDVGDHSARVNAVLQRALAKRAEDRYPSCSAFLEELLQAGAPWE